MAVSKRKATARGGAVESSNVPLSPLSGIPEEFTAAPEKILPLLSTLDKSNVYILHMDTHTVDVKKQMFNLALLFNVAILGGFIWRAIYAVPRYIHLLAGAFGLPGYEGTTVGISTTVWRETLSMLGWRGGIFFLDYLLAQLTWTWLSQFFLEQQNGQLASPAYWRWKVGFQPTEIVVRRSKGWGVDRLLAKGFAGANNHRVEQLRDGVFSPPNEKTDNLSNTEIFNTRVRPAVSPHYLAAKTGYLMIGPEYNLDYSGMIEASRMMKSNELTSTDIAVKVAIWVESTTVGGQWMVWDYYSPGEALPEFRDREIMLNLAKLEATQRRHDSKGEDATSS